MAPSTLDQEELLKSGLFDPQWYLDRNTDVQILGMDPLEHFLWLGSRLNRSPGPKFDSERYLQVNVDVARTDYNPVLHYIRYGKKEGRQAFEVSETSGDLHRRHDSGPRRTTGDVPYRPGRPTVLLCSHVAGETLFGGERSLLDMLGGLDALDFNVIVTVPGTGNAAYFEVLKSEAHAVYTLSYGWWRKGQPINEKLVAHFAHIMSENAVDVVHTNTIVLREPLIAARRMGLRSLVHARELIRHDQALLNMIGEPAESIVEQVWDNADQVIANSRATQDGFALDGRTPALVYNTADLDALSRLPAPAQDRALRVGLISSNIPKKGIWDFAQVAKTVSQTHPEMLFHLIGPENTHTADIDQQVAAGTLPKSLRVLGYRDTPAEAIAETDVVLSLSQFQESFGRTVLEGMAAARPAVVYDHGAPPEFVRHGETGHVVPLGDIDAVADTLRKLADDPDALRAMGRRAQADVSARFGAQAYIAQMREVYEPLLDAPAPATRKITLPARMPLDPMPRSALKIAYFCWHFPVPSETFVLNELRLLRAQGIDVRVFCRQSPYPDFAPDFDIEWERVKDADHLAQRLTETGITNVHAHFVYPTVTDMVWPACETAQIPFTYIAHAQDIFRYRNDAANRVSEVSASPLCRKVFVPSRFHRGYLEARGVPAEKMMINPNGCDHRLYAEGHTPDRATRPFRRIIAIHRFTEKKGLVHLIRAGKLLEQDNVRIELYGYGELEDEYREAIRAQGITNVALCGPVKGRDAMLKLYRESDLFACPSVRASDGDMDGIPTVLMEAMAAGLPVLTTDLSGIPDLVEDGITGLVCEPTPEAIAARIRAYYALPDVAVQAIIDTASDRIRADYNTEHLVENLVRTWARETIDLMIVSWNNLAQTSEVIRRLYKYTSLPFHLIVCDNGSSAPALAHLLDVYGTHDNVTIVLNRENALVGPGTNICLDQGRSDYAIYVCGKEGMTTRYGWETSFVSYMNANPRVGLAGTLCYSPSYLFGRDYPKAQALFHKFRNQEFATQNPDREFSHVQGGFFAIRRAMTDKIGAFSTEVPHNSTDVEFSYFVESSGWELGEVPGLMALFNKTRPGLLHRVDESIGALHPPTLADLPALDAIARREVHHCNVCARQSPSFTDLDGAAPCPHCGATRRTRSVHRVLAESLLLYRRLPALAVNLPSGLDGFWREQFQGRICDADTLDSELAGPLGRTDFSDARLQVVLLNDVLTARFETSGTLAPRDTRVLAEAARLLAPKGTLIVAGSAQVAAMTQALAKLGFASAGAKRYASSVSHYDWFPVLFFTRLRHDAT